MRRIALAIAISTLFAARVGATIGRIETFAPDRPGCEETALSSDIHQPDEGRRRRHVCQPGEGFGNDRRAVRAHSSAAFRIAGRRHDSSLAACRADRLAGLRRVIDDARHPSRRCRTESAAEGHREQPRGVRRAQSRRDRRADLRSGETLAQEPQDCCDRLIAASSGIMMAVAKHNSSVMKNAVTVK